MSFAAEMIVPAAIEDDFGRPAKPTKLLERLDPDGPVNLLPSWRRFVDDINNAFDRVGK